MSDTDDAFSKIIGTKQPWLLSEPSPSEKPQAMPGPAFIVVFPATDLHFKLAKKLATCHAGQLVPLSPDEMALLSEFMVWPKQQLTASF